MLRIQVFDLDTRLDLLTTFLLKEELLRKIDNLEKEGRRSNTLQALAAKAESIRQHDSAIEVVKDKKFTEESTKMLNTNHKNASKDKVSGRDGSDFQAKKYMGELCKGTNETDQLAW